MANDCGIDSRSTEAVTISGDDPIRTCLEELRGDSVIRVARRMAPQRGVALPGGESVASGLVIVAADGDVPDGEHGLAPLGGRTAKSEDG